MDKPLDIFDYSDYRLYLKEWVERARASGVSNLSRLAEATGVHTTFLSHVLSGKKNLNLEQATLISEAIAQTKIERDYFFVLIDLDRAGTDKLRSYFRERKNEIEHTRLKLHTRVGTHHELTDEERAIFYSSWIYVALFVTCAIEGGQSLEQLATRFSLSREKADEFMTFLAQTGICVLKDGVYSMGTKVVYVPNSSPFVVKHHTNWRMRAVQKMDARTDGEMFFTSPMTVSAKDFARIRELLAKVVQDSLAIVSRTDPEDVVCLNIDFFKTLV